LNKDKKEWDIIIFADTICVLDGKIIEKPVKILIN